MNIQDSKSLVVIITGGTRGIGRGLAKCFLERGASVVISGRIGEVVRRAVEELKAEVAGPGSALKSAEAVPVAGTECDVREFAQVQALWDYAISSFGRVDIWINNAGIGQPQSDIDELKPDLIRDIFGTNCTGALYGCKVAMTGMRAQGDGAIYNLEGLGSNGSIVRGMAAYGASKRAAGVHYRFDGEGGGRERCDCRSAASRHGCHRPDYRRICRQTRGMEKGSSHFQHSLRQGGNRGPLARGPDAAEPQKRQEDCLAHGAENDGTFSLRAFCEAFRIPGNGMMFEGRTLGPRASRSTSES